jgi:O-acetyl-ADP-ribose deacetylase (regulator of RNase III)
LPIVDVLAEGALEAPADALVNPANRQPTLWWGSHVSEAIYRRAGSQVRRERKAHGTIGLGDAVVTSGGLLPFRYIIHAAVLDVWDLNPLFLLRLRQRTSDGVLARAARNSLILADSLPVTGLVFTPMGSGVGAMPLERCARILLGEVQAFQASRPNTGLHRVLFAVKTTSARDVFLQVGTSLNLI